jgi:sulfur carrier protein
VIELTINGKHRNLDRSMSVLDYLEQLSINPRIVAVELNGEILRRERYAEAVLHGGDVLEIVRMVGGGCR